MLAPLLLLLADTAPPGLSGKLKPPPEVVLRPSAPTPAATPGTQPEPMRVGAHIDAGPAMKKGKWAKLADGRRVWRLSVRSPGAKAIRVHFDRFAGVAGTVWVHDGGAAVGSYTGDGPSGDKAFWSHPVVGERAVVEFVPTQGKAIPFVVDRISHQVVE
jgi:hypothetical protein